jgi:hypothetical protein
MDNNLPIFKLYQTGKLSRQNSSTSRWSATMEIDTDSKIDSQLESNLKAKFPGTTRSEANF